MSRWFSLWSRLRDLLRPHRDREIDDELRFHIEEEVEAGLRAGLTAEQARAAAHASLGAMPALVREQVQEARGLPVVDDVRRDVRHGLRLLWRNPVFSMVVLSTLAVAIGAVVTTFSIADAWLFRPLAFPAADRLVVAFAAAPATPTEPAVWMPYRAYRSWRDGARAFSAVSAAFFQGGMWRTSSEALSVVGMRVTPEFFTTFGVPPLHGRPLAAADADGPRALVLGYGFWQRALGGSSAVLGTTVTLSDTPYNVVGIMPQDFDVRLLDRPEGAAFWTLLRPGEPGYGPDGIGPVAIVGRLRDGVTIEAAQAEVAALTRRTESAYALNFNRFVVNLSSLQADNTRTVRATLVTVLAAALCLLLVAAMNVGALLLGWGLGRQGEVAVRHALGAGRARLVRQFLTEGLVLSVCGGVLGLGLAAMATRLFLAWNPLGTLPANTVRLDGRALAAAALAMALTAIVSGLAPAMRLSVRRPAETLRGNELRGRSTVPVQRLQTGMLIAQMAASVVLLVCTVLLARTFVQLRTEPLGFTSDDITVATVELPKTPFASSAERNAFYRQVAAGLLAKPGVRGVTASTIPPLVTGPPATVNRTAVDDMSAPRVSTHDVTMEYFDTLAIPVIAGRGFDRRDEPQGAPVVILNERAATDLFGSAAGAVGRRLRLDTEPWRQVVGVVGNVRTTFFNTLGWRTDPIIYRPADQAFSGTGSPSATTFTLYLHIRAARTLSAEDVRQAALLAGPRAAVLNVRRTSALVAEATRQPTFRVTLLLWCAGVSLLLAAIGTYGLVSQIVSARLREIAIRLALGAKPATVGAALVRGALGAGTAGVAIGVVTSAMLGQSLASVVYGVGTRDGASVTAAAFLLLAVAGLAAWLPARRAMRSDPAGVLRGQ